MIKKSLLILVPLAVLVLGGCGSSPAPELGDKKEDWAKTPPPAGWVGPGQAAVQGANKSPAPSAPHMEGPPPAAGQ